MRFTRKTTAAVITSLLTIVIAIGLFVRPDSKLGWLGNIITVPLSPFQKLLSMAGNKLEESFSFISEARELRTENSRLRESLNGLDEALRRATELKTENEQLKKIVIYKERFGEYDFLNANIIAKDAGNWFNVFVVDRGISDGIVMGRKGLYSAYYPVVTGDGLAGRVVSSYMLSSKILSIIDEGSTVSAIITKNRSIVEVKGDITLKDEGLCIIENIKMGDESGIAPGDTVETSGLGGIYPKGIIIGKVVETGRNEKTMSSYAILKPAVNFEKLEEVFIMRSKTVDDGLVLP